jgi:Uma2 family endonuclease
MIESGILTEDDPVELLEGWVVFKMPRNAAHDASITLSQQALTPILPAGCHIRIQSALTLEDSEPEPDLAVVAGDPRAYASNHPDARHVLLVIEVADSSLQRDRDVKGPMYARASIPAYWLVNLVDRVVEVYAAPSGTGTRAAYQSRVVYQQTDLIPVSLLNATSVSVRAGDLLP